MMAEEGAACLKKRVREQRTASLVREISVFVLAV